MNDIEQLQQDLITFKAGISILCDAAKVVIDAADSVGREDWLDPDIRKSCERLERCLSLPAVSKAIDEIEQLKHEANAWTEVSDVVHLQVFYSPGDHPFISAVCGAICLDELAKIQAVMIQHPGEYFGFGACAGYYFFMCKRVGEERDEVGVTECAHWKVNFEKFNRFPWADEKDEGDEQ